MNVLLTGSNGFLGKTIVEILQKEHQVSTLARSSGQYQLSLDKQVPDFKEIYNLIIHSAGKAHSVPKTEEEIIQFFNVNVTGTLNLLQALENTAIPEQFVFISSVSVYGRETGKNIDENYSLDAKDPYGLSKIEAEKIVINWCKRHNVICTILRLPLLVGKNPPGNLGAMIRAIKRGYYFNIGKGEARKSMVLCNDVALFIPIVSKVGGIYNLTDGYHPSFKDLSSVISKQKNKKLPFNLPLLVARLLGYVGDFLGNKAPINSSKIKKITCDLTFDDSKARKLLNWNPEPVLQYLEKNII